ncbi:uncharacterized protein O3C94_011348 [Discoglossus pictus]
MTPQQTARQPSTSRKDLGARIQEHSKRMRASVQRRRSTPSSITRALSKSQSREITQIPTNTGNGLLLGAFCSPSSMFILKDRVRLTNGWQTQERLLFLFNDSLIITKSKSSSSFKLKQQVRLNEMWVSSSLSDVSEKKLSADNSFVIGWPLINYVVTFSSSDTKEKWLSALFWHINNVKKEEYPKNIPINVIYLDADEFTTSAAVMISNMDTSEKVIKMASQQLGVPQGNPSDYHLCVMSGKNDPLYPLIGHEYPFSITMNYLRDSLELPNGSNNNLFLDQTSEMMIMDQFLKDRQCQFILKLKLLIPQQMRRDPAQKYSRRKKSLIDWALRRSGSSPLNSPAPQSPTTPRKLFGLSLSAVCTNGNLPKPIMDMLLLLYKEGPNTTGIFRRSANAKTRKEVKEKLISGDDVQMQGESVLIAAAVITDFLRNIPESILSADMYEQWMNATDMEQHQFKIETIKRLVEQLPEANNILLQHLFAVLHHIEQNSEVNQMTAYNLAVCIAPNMLWLPTATDPEVEGRSTKKVVLLVQFLIENYKQIFGQDAASLFGKCTEEDPVGNDSLAGKSQIHCQDSSDEQEFVPSDLEKSDPNLLIDLDGIFDESLLIEEMEDWDLFSEITACYESKTSMNNLEFYNKDTFNGMESACSLSPSRDRCSSEPSVCLSSRLPVQGHEPVARQSSCDATIMHNHIDYINQLKQLQLERQNNVDEGQSPSGKKSRHAFWRSPHSSLRMKKKSQQKAISSNRSSFSSLSSTTTSPSASSISSLDSAFSYCSESSVFCPSDASSMPFMFGTSARLHTLSPEISKKKLKEWHGPISRLLSSNSSNSCDLTNGVHEEPKACSKMKSVQVYNEAANEVIVETNIQIEECTSQKTDDVLSNRQVQERMSTLFETKCEPKASQENGSCAQRETSVKHIQIRKSESSNDDSLKRTKITFFMSPNIMHAKNSEEEKMKTGTTVPEPETMKLQIPQTVFYGQNSPLVLRSVSRRQHSDEVKPHWQTQMRHVLKRSSVKAAQCDDKGATGESPTVVKDDQRHSLGEHHTEEQAFTKKCSKTMASFSHTIHITLPASVKNTVREYFKHHDSHSSPQVESVEHELIRSNIERCNMQEVAGDREVGDLEESFV